MKTSEIVMTGVFAQLYARLVMAAINRVHIYYMDLAPVVFGVQFSKMDNSQVEAVWQMLRMSMQMDMQHNRPPLAALFVSRASELKKPGRSFFNEYEKITGIKLSYEDWQKLVEEVWAHYSMQDFVGEQS